MKKIFLLFTSLFVAAIINAQAPATTAQASTNVVTPAADVSKALSFKEENHDFGKIPYGKPVEFDVEIKNISSDSIKIENVKVACGCTTPKYQQGPYAPGEAFKVTLGFSGYADGPFDKYVDIFFNNGMTKQIRFHGVGYKVAETTPSANTGIQKLKNRSK
ncbi:MAG: DUF1573 domain-containing protein [Segetibacter sp.]|nr:DUF1573 domain-containing protein [Segetibacter sp.]